MKIPVPVSTFWFNRSVGRGQTIDNSTKLLWVVNGDRAIPCDPNLTRLAGLAHALNGPVKGFLVL